MLDFKSYVKKIMSKSLSQHLAVVTGKIKTKWKRKNVYIFASFYHIFNIPIY